MSSPHQSVPPARSSHTSDSGSDTGLFPDVRFRSDWLWLTGLLVLPLVIALPLWLFRLQTDVTSDGVEVRGLIRTRRIPWSEIAGVSLPGFGRVYLTTTDGTRIALPGVDFNRLRRLVAASRGRLADPGVRVLGLPRLAHIAVFMVALGALFPVVGAPLWAVLYVIPVALAVWIERTRTRVSADGLDLRTMFGSRHIDWSEVKGLQIPKRGALKLHLADESDVALPAVGYDRLEDLIEASDGRIPDPFLDPEDVDALAAVKAAAGIDDAADSATAATEAEPRESAKAEGAER